MERPFQDNGGAIVQRMGQRSVGVNPFEAVGVERKLLETRRTGGHGEYGCTDIVQKARQSKRRRPRAAAYFSRRLVDRNLEPGAGKQNRRGEAIWP